MKPYLKLLVFSGLLLLSMNTFSQDRNFYIFLCIRTIEHGGQCKN